MTTQEYFQAHSMKRRVAREGNTPSSFYFAIGILILANAYLIADYLQSRSAIWELIAPIGFTAFIALLLAFICTPLAATLWLPYFRKTSYYQKSLGYSLSSSGISMESPSIKSETKWDAIVRAREDDAGFALYLAPGRSSFHWLPKHGFSLSDDIDRCRAKIQQYVSDYRMFSS